MRAPKPKDAKPKGTKLKTLKRVLVVEDDPVLSLSLDEALRDAGVREVVICATLESTIEALEKADADAVVIDVHLADRDDGWALAELVGQLGPRRPRIVFSTGSPEDIPAEIAEMGLVFAKPYDPAELARELASGEESKGLFSKLRDAIS